MSGFKYFQLPYGSEQYVALHTAAMESGKQYNEGINKVINDIGVEGGIFVISGSLPSLGFTENQLLSGIKLNGTKYIFSKTKTNRILFLNENGVPVIKTEATVHNGELFFKTRGLNNTKIGRQYTTDMEVELEKISLVENTPSALNYINNLYNIPRFAIGDDDRIYRRAIMISHNDCSDGGIWIAVPLDGQSEVVDNLTRAGFIERRRGDYINAEETLNDLSK